jgi:thiol-disulfide isomerase/thioredoxin
MNELTEKSFNGANLKSKICSIVLFYSPQCIHCQSMKDDWAQFAKKSSNKNIFSYNCLANEFNPELKAVVKGYPTILFFKNGKIVKEYHGNRTTESFLTEMKSTCGD